MAIEINASIEARRERNAIEAATPITADLNLDAEMAEGKPLDPRRWKHYTRMLDILSAIHGEIAVEANAQREAMRGVFSRLEDRFIPLDGSSLVELMLDVAKKEQQHKLP